MNGLCLLRIEDIDTVRCRPEFVAAIFEDLAWLGLDWPKPVRRQSEHFSDYRHAAEQLKQMGLLYPCFCSRSEIAAKSDGRTDPDGAPIYGGTCKRLSQAERAARIAEGLAHSWRLDMAGALERSGPVSIRETMPHPDAPIVLRQANPARWGDVVIVRKDTPTSYHLSVVVDDALQEVTHVTRGMDLYASTDIHVLLQALLDLATPIYTHHGLITDLGDNKLSKSKGSQSLRDLRSAGWTPEAVQARLGC